MPPRQPFPATRAPSLLKSRRRVPLPSVWLFTDERIEGELRVAIAACPPRAGIVFRNDGLARGPRARLLRTVRRLARARDMTLVVAGAPPFADRHGAGGVHLRRPARAEVRRAHRRGLVVTAPVHDPMQRAAAARAGVDLMFVSPVFATRSHPGGAILGVAVAVRLMRGSRVAAVPLGGMTDARARRVHRRLASKGPVRFAAIDFWLERAQRRRERRDAGCQKRNCVPT